MNKFLPGDAFVWVGFCALGPKLKDAFDKRSTVCYPATWKSHAYWSDWNSVQIQDGKYSLDASTPDWGYLGRLNDDSLVVVISPRLEKNEHPPRNGNRSSKKGTMVHVVDALVTGPDRQEPRIMTLVIPNRCLTYKDAIRHVSRKR